MGCYRVAFAGRRKVLAGVPITCSFTFAGTDHMAHRGVSEELSSVFDLRVPTFLQHIRNHQLIRECTNDRLCSHSSQTYQFPESPGM